MAAEQKYDSGALKMLNFDLTISTYLCHLIIQSTMILLQYNGFSNVLSNTDYISWGIRGNLNLQIDIDLATLIEFTTQLAVGYHTNLGNGLWIYSPFYPSILHLQISRLQNRVYNTKLPPKL